MQSLTPNNTNMKDDFPNYDEWFGDFLGEVKRLGYSGPVDQDGVEGYYEADDLYPDEAARQFVAAS